MASKKVSEKHKHKADCPVPKGKLLAIGGKEDKGEKELSEEQKRNIDFISEQILKRFADELSGSIPMIAIIPSASNEPDKLIKDYEKVFKSLNINNLEVINIKSRKDVFDPAFMNIAKRAAGFMFTGGDQLRLTSILGGSAILQLIKDRYTYENIIVAGTSAGATALSTPMIYEGVSKGGYIKGDVRVTTGLEFLKNVAIDTHFIARGRIIRMSQAIATNPGCIGIGLEEDTAILVTEGKNLEVIGSGLVTIIDGMNIDYNNISEIDNGEPFSVKNMKVHLLSDNHFYEIPVYNT